jgi:MarR family transcriptional regulator, temperature-dependent positive regulator of motility
MGFDEDNPIPVSGASQSLGDSPSHLLHRAQQISAEFLANAVRDAGLTQRQYVVLNALNEAKGLTQTALVDATGIDRSTLAELVARMEQRGLIARERSPHDARANLVTLSEGGLAALETCRERARAADDAVLSAFPKAKRQVFIDMLKLLTGELSTSEAKMGKKKKKPKSEKKSAVKKKKSRKKANEA